MSIASQWTGYGLPKTTDCKRQARAPSILTVALPGEHHATVTNEARRRNMTRSTLAREIIENALVPGTTDATRSCADPAGDIVDAVRSGRTDLATNRRLLDEAVAQDARCAVTDSHR